MLLFHNAIIHTDIVLEREERMKKRIGLRLLALVISFTMVAALLPAQMMAHEGNSDNLAIEPPEAWDNWDAPDNYDVQDEPAESGEPAEPTDPAEPADPIEPPNSLEPPDPDWLVECEWPVAPTDPDEPEELEYPEEPEEPEYEHECDEYCEECEELEIAGMLAPIQMFSAADEINAHWDLFVGRWTDSPRGYITYVALYRDDLVISRLGFMATSGETYFRVSFANYFDQSGTYRFRVAHASTWGAIVPYELLEWSWSGDLVYEREAAQLGVATDLRWGEADASFRRVHWNTPPNMPPGTRFLVSLYSDGLLRSSGVSAPNGNSFGFFESGERHHFTVRAIEFDSDINTTRATSGFESHPSPFFGEDTNLPGGSGGNGSGNGGSGGGGGGSDDDSENRSNRATIIHTITTSGGAQINISVRNRNVNLGIISTIMSALINEAENGEVSFDLSGLDTSVTAITIPRAALRRFGLAGLNVVIHLEEGRITLTPDDINRIVRWSFNRHHETTTIRFVIDAENDNFSVVSSTGPRIANFGSLLGSEPYAQRAMDTEELVAIKEDDEVEEVVEQDVA